MPLAGQPAMHGCEAGSRLDIQELSKSLAGFSRKHGLDIQEPAGTLQTAGGPIKWRDQS